MCLVTENTALVHYIVHKYFNKTSCDFDYDDYVSVGNIALVKAAKYFDESKGYKFATYASKLIYGEILRYQRDNSNLIHTTRNETTDFRKLKYFMNKYPYDTERAIEESGLTVERCKYLKPLLDGISSFSFTNENVDRSSTIEESIPDNVDVENEVINKVFVEELLSVLDNDYKQILIWYFCDGLSQSEIADLIGTSQVQVHRNIERGLKAVREQRRITRKRSTSISTIVNDMFDKGMTFQEVKAETGFNENTLRFYRSRWLQNGRRKAV